MEYQLPPAHKRAFERLKAMMHAYLVERDAEKALTFYTEDVQSIGTGVQEVAFNKEQLRRLLEEEIRIDPLPFQISFEQVVASGRHSDTSVSLYTVLKVEKLLPSGIPICVAMRQTELMCESERRILHSVRFMFRCRPLSRRTMNIIQLSSARKRCSSGVNSSIATCSG